MSESEPQAPGFGWENLARFSVAALLLAAIVTMVVIIGGIDLTLTIILVLLFVALWLTRRGGKAGPIMLLVLNILFLGFGGFFVIQALMTPESTIELMANSIFLVAGILGLVAAIGLVRTGRGTPSPRARSVLVAGSLVLLAFFAWAIVVRVTYDEPPLNSGDAQLTAEDTLYKPTHLDVPAGDSVVVVDNKDFGSHTFTIEKLGVDEVAAGGVASEVHINDAEPGTYEFRCTIAGHDKMKGTLTVF